MSYYQEYESQIVTTQHNTTQPNTFLSAVETCLINKEGEGEQSGPHHPHHQGHHNPPGPDKWAAAIGFKLIQTPTKFL